MISYLLLNELQGVLGDYTKTARDNYKFHCPFCNHRKRKLEVSMDTDSKGHNFYHCWVCNTKGNSIKGLLYKLNVDSQVYKRVVSNIPNSSYSESGRNSKKYNAPVRLPDDMIYMVEADIDSYYYKMANNYLKNRGLTYKDYIKYNIGYCYKGEYAGRIIIPSYDEDNRLNFFIARTFQNAPINYELPEASRDIVPMENQINWEAPITLVEGVFDAMAVKRNAIPMLGNSLGKEIYRKLLINKVETVYISLDNDAFKKALNIAEKLISEDIKVYLVKLEEKDPSKMGFENYTKMVQNAEKLTLNKIVQYKLNL